ncbi:store-operated calcium entry-associated regulatory factor-like [Salvelinus namaycush]|uniref:Store-operated calcium entry-associated regulatory factor n=1 Tax=Salvelinus namaycush TaxID=8040 RepID=A0A8U0U2V0_SALNM|nr:store-operated calcium entry-associated regulatory factor-like [Salvelinus namaycush]
MKGLLRIVLLFLSVAHIRSWNEAPGSVLLRDVQVLTLYKGKYTTARRSSAVPQLQCVGGSAGCGSFIPDVVQCKNKGWDGVDAQWECKTDMDNAYKFGQIEVSCEGFNHPDDSYILKGSCGLEYSLELTEEGKRRHKGGSHGSTGGFSDFASSFFKGSSDNNNQHHHSNNRQQSSTGEGNSSGLVVVALLLFLAYGVYKLFLSGPTNLGQDGQFPDNGSNTHNPHGPPPPGFKPDFTGSSSGYPGASGFPGSAGGYAGSAGYGANPGYGFRSGYSGQQQQQHFAGARAAGGTGNSFWTGMGTGGVLGYLFGSQRSQTPYTNTHSNYSAPRTPPTPAPSTGTRAASGFGGTKRR